MVKFEFTLSDHDAENLMNILHQEKMRIINKKFGYLKSNPTDSDKMNARWLESHAEYISTLISKILSGNTKVSE